MMLMIQRMGRLQTLFTHGRPLAGQVHMHASKKPMQVAFYQKPALNDKRQIRRSRYQRFMRNKPLVISNPITAQGLASLLGERSG